MVNPAYTKEDVNSKDEIGYERSDEWHENELDELAIYVKELLENADNVPKWLTANPSMKFTPPRLIEIEGNASETNNLN